MPYRKTEFAPGHYYHVFNRGFCRIPIFRNKGPERLFFVKRALKLSEKYDVSIESRAIMNNHYHFILVQNDKNDGIQQMLYRLQMAFAQYYNKRHERRGPVFEGRYKAKLIHDDKYYFDVTNYVFRNPVK